MHSLWSLSIESLFVKCCMLCIYCYSHSPNDLCAMMRLSMLGDVLHVIVEKVEDCDLL